MRRSRSNASDSHSGALGLNVGRKMLFRFRGIVSRTRGVYGREGGENRRGKIRIRIRRIQKMNSERSRGDM